VPEQTETFTGRRAIVTGGLSGIGAATAALLASRGAAVAVLDRGNGADVTVDVRDAEAVDAAVAAAAERLGGPADVLVASAGIYRIAPFLDLEPAAWDDVLGTNLRGVYLTGRTFARALVGAGRPGTIVNLASTAALVGDADEPGAHYNASKAGVVSLTRQMAIELAPHGIRVNCVCPGVIDTPMLRLMDDPAAGERYLRESVPLRRLGSANEVAAAIAFLASDAAAYITGAAVPIDGGSTLL
jgi:meso-butanediol dehydrogenase / (S,S)-butanediol dehydrogenase / diacetyl reductase